jgi:predicted metal-dependent peptidase
MIDDILERITEKEPLFTSMVYHLKPVESDECATASTDGEHIFYSKDFLESLTPDEQCGVILHEVLHNAFMHLWRRGKRKPEKWNIATDYAINTIVDESFPLPAGTLLDTKYYGMDAESIYDSLKDQKKKKQQGWCQKDKWEDGKQKKGSSSGDQKGKKGQGIGDQIKKVFGKKDPKPTKSQAQREAEWRGEFEKLTKEYGRLPDSLKRIIDKRYYVPVVDWTALVSSILSEDTNDYSFSTPDRRFLEDDYMLPDLYSIDAVKDVVFGYDTSGSISEEDLRSFYMETMHLFENFSSLQGWIAVCDADLHSFEEVSPRNSFEDFHFMGGGGTAFEPVFEEIERKKLKPKAVFYFTDTYGSFPEDPGYPVFWLVRSYVGDSSEPEVPFGTVIKFLPKTV